MEYEATTVEGRYVLKDHARTGTLRRPGQGRCIVADGSNDNLFANGRVSSGAVTALSGGGWAKITAGHTKNHVIMAEFAGGGARAWKLEVDMTTLAVVLYLSNNGTDSITFTTTETLTGSTWAHVWFSYDGGGGTVAIYINGAAATVTPSGAVPASLFNASTNFSVCSDALGGSDLLGSLADLRLYSVAKNAAAVLAIYNQANTPTTYDTTGLLGWWPVVEECCSILHDASGNGKHLTIANASTLPTGTFFAADSTIPFNLANEYGCNFGRTILKNAAGTWNGAWRSSTTLVGNGYIEWVVDALNVNAVFGAGTDTAFTSTNNQNVIDFGVAWETSTSILLYTNGGITASHTCTLVIGDRIRIVRTGGDTLKVTQNGVDIATFGATSSADLYAWCALNATTITPDCTSVNGQEPTTGATQAVRVYLHVIPRSLDEPTEDIYANPITYTGQCPHPATAEATCVTTEGTAVYLANSASLLPASADFTLSFWIRQPAVTTSGPILAQFTTLGGATRFAITWSGGSAVNVQFASSTFVSSNASVAENLPTGTWSKVTLVRSGSDWTLTHEIPAYRIKVVATASNATNILQVDTTLLAAWNVENTSISSYAKVDSSISDLRITTGGVTKVWPLQDGPGDSNTNRTHQGYASDFSAVTDFTSVNGTVADINAVLNPYAADDILERGGTIAAGIAVWKNNTTDVDGNALTHVAGEWPGGNLTRNNRLNLNPFSAALLNGVGVETAYEAGDDREAVAVADTKFRRTNSTDDIDDRFFVAVASRTGIAAPTGLSGDDLTDAQTYVS
jgi:hypothetical protein